MKNLTEETYSDLVEGVGYILVAAACMAALIVIGTVCCSAFEIVRHTYPKACCENK